MRRKVDVNNLFIEVYQALSASMVGRDDIDCTNSIILPSSALAKLSYMKDFGANNNVKNRQNNDQKAALFRILNIQLNTYTHCGVAEFTAEEGTCYIPSDMFDRLCLEPGQKVNIRSIKLPEGTYIKIQPHKTEFINNPNPKAILEYNLRNYFCVTQGDTISVKFNKKIYKIDILECKPEKQIRTLNCNIQVDFAPPKDYKEEEKPKQKQQTNLKFNSNEKHIKLSKEEIEKQIMDKKFSGHHFRIDGKDITSAQALKVKEKKEKKNAEENYDPRKCRIESNPRPSFKYVEL